MEGVLVRPKVRMENREEQTQEGENKMNGGTSQGSVQHPLHPYQNRVTQ